MFDDDLLLDRDRYGVVEALSQSQPDVTAEGGGCSVSCSICNEPCTKVPNHSGSHYCPTHHAYGL